MISAVALTVVNGLCTAVIGSFDGPLWKKCLLLTGMALSVAGTILFILARQPYAGLFYLCLLVIKGFSAIKS